MRILFLTHAFNSLTQRLYVELTAQGHDISIELDINDSVTVEAVELFRPHLILAPYLRRAIPEAIWREHVCLIVHPGIVGDRGPSALDWAIMNGESEWGVTVLQAEAEMDAGPVWASETFPMRAARKSPVPQRGHRSGAARRSRRHRPLARLPGRNLVAAGAAPEAHACAPHPGRAGHRLGTRRHATGAAQTQRGGRFSRGCRQPLQSALPSIQHPPF